MNKLFFLFLLTVTVLTGCREEPLPEPEVQTKKQVPASTQKVNQFISDAMSTFYLWNKELPDIDIRYEADSKAYFDKLLYEEDKWSFITDDIVELENSFKGIETSFGYSLAFGRFRNSGSIYAVIEFVYPRTPASEAGLKRGDFLISLDNSDITEDTYMNLINGGTITLTKGKLGDGGVYPVEDVTMTSRELNLNPVVKTSIIEHEGYKIGYLLYAQFIDEYNSALDTALQHFKDEQVTNLVVDLRYNPGGTISAAQYLCSSVAPFNVVNPKSQLVTFQWNDILSQYWSDRNRPDQLEVKFVDTTLVQMDLDNIYILTGEGTASASELTITGLSPYMNLTTVGDTTFGKYTGSITLKPEYIYDEDETDYSSYENWGIQPIVIRYANSQGVTDFRDGFYPDIPVEDDLLSGFPLGDKNEPLLKAAIDDITGSEIVAQKSAGKQNLPSFQVFDRASSTFDKYKRDLIIDGDLKNQILK